MPIEWILMSAAQQEMDGMEGRGESEASHPSAADEPISAAPPTPPAPLPAPLPEIPPPPSPPVQRALPPDPSPPRPPAPKAFPPKPPPPPHPAASLREAMLARQRDAGARIVSSFGKVERSFTAQYEFGDSLRNGLLEGHAKVMQDAQSQIEALQAAAAVAGQGGHQGNDDSSGQG